MLDLSIALVLTNCLVNIIQIKRPGVNTEASRVPPQSYAPVKSTIYIYLYNIYMLHEPYDIFTVPRTKTIKN